MAEEAKPVEEVAEPAPSEPTKTPKQDLVEQYELGDTQPDPEVDQSPSLPGSPEEEGTTPPPARPRGPDGKFKKQAPQHLIKLALDFGLSDEEIQDVDPEVLAQTVYHLNRQMRNMQESNSRETAILGATNQPLEEKPEEPITLGVDESKFDPDLVSMFKELKKENRDLRNELNQVKQVQINQHSETMAQKIDRLFETQNENLFGKGRGAEMDQSGPEYARRLAVLRAVKEDKAKGSFEQKFQKYSKMLFGAENQNSPAAVARKFTKEEWEEGALRRPTARAGAGEPKGEKKAMQTAARFMRENGMTDESDPSAEDFLE